MPEVDARAETGCCYYVTVAFKHNILKSWGSKGQWKQEKNVYGRQLWFLTCHPKGLTLYYNLRIVRNSIRCALRRKSSLFFSCKFSIISPWWFVDNASSWFAGDHGQAGEAIYIRCQEGWWREQSRTVGQPAKTGYIRLQIRDVRSSDRNG